MSFLLSKSDGVGMGNRPAPRPVGKTPVYRMMIEIVLLLAWPVKKDEKARRGC